jgi:hypothetical protein
MRVRVVLSAAALVGTLAACTADAPVAAPAPASTVIATPSTSTSPSASTPSSASPSATPSTDEPLAILDDQKGDGGDADITEVRMLTNADGLVLQVTLADDAPTSGTFAVFFNVASNDGEIVRQLGMKWVDDEAIPPFSFDAETAEQTNYDDAPTKIYDGNRVGGQFPLEAIEGLGTSWRWQAVTSVEGNDEDFAPQEGKADFPSN